MLLNLKSSALSIANILGKLVSTAPSGAGWYLTCHRWMVKFRSHTFVKNHQGLSIMQERDSSTGRQVGKENVWMFSHVQKQSARKDCNSCNVLKGANSEGTN